MSVLYSWNEGSFSWNFLDLFSLFLLTHEFNEIKSPTKNSDFTVL